jgi:hypothetical protein
MNNLRKKVKDKCLSKRRKMLRNRQVYEPAELHQSKPFIRFWAYLSDIFLKLEEETKSPKRAG